MISLLYKKLKTILYSQFIQIIIKIIQDRLKQPSDFKNFAITQEKQFYRPVVLNLIWFVDPFVENLNTSGSLLSNKTSFGVAFVMATSFHML